MKLSDNIYFTVQKYLSKRIDEKNSFYYYDCIDIDNLVYKKHAV